MEKSLKKFMDDQKLVYREYAGLVILNLDMLTENQHNEILDILDI